MAAPPDGNTPLERECAALVERLRTLCPEVLPATPLTPGAPGRPVPVDGPAVAGIVVTALRQAAGADMTGRQPPTDEALPRVVVWVDGVSSLAVELAAVHTETADGLITFTVPVRCDPRQRGAVRVAFTVGTPARPTGLLVATPRRPGGPDVIVDRWGEALVAVCWRALLDASAGVAAAAGTDPDGTPLIVAALTATDAGLQILPQARHPFDRVGTGRAVRPQ